MEKYKKFTKLTAILLTWKLVTIPAPVNPQLGNVNFIFGLSGDIWILTFPVISFMERLLLYHYPKDLFSRDSSSLFPLTSL